MSRNDSNVAISTTRHPVQTSRHYGDSHDMSGKCRVVSFASTKKRKKFRGRVQLRRQDPGFWWFLVDLEETKTKKWIPGDDSQFGGIFEPTSRGNFFFNSIFFTSRRANPVKKKEMKKKFLREKWVKKFPQMRVHQSLTNLWYSQTWMLC